MLEKQPSCYTSTNHVCVFWVFPSLGEANRLVVSGKPTTFLHVPASPFSPFSPFLPSLPSLPGIPTFPSVPGGPAGPALPGGPGDPGTLQRSRGAPFAFVSNSWPKTAWQRHMTPISAHIFGSVDANSKTQGRLAGSQRCSVRTIAAYWAKKRQVRTKWFPFVDSFSVPSHDEWNCNFVPLCPTMSYLCYFCELLNLSWSNWDHQTRSDE